MSTLNSSLSRAKYVVWLWLFGISSFRIKGYSFCFASLHNDCAQLQYTIQHKTVLIISALTSRQLS